MVNPKKLHSELLSFATRPVGEAGNIFPERKAQPSVMAPTTSSMSPWPLQRESRIIVDEDGVVWSLSVDAQTSFPTDIRGRFCGESIFNILSHVERLMDGTKSKQQGIYRQVFRAMLLECLGMCRWVVGVLTGSL